MEKAISFPPCINARGKGEEDGGWEGTSLSAASTVSQTIFLLRKKYPVRQKRWRRSQQHVGEGGRWRMDGRGRNLQYCIRTTHTHTHTHRIPRKKEEFCDVWLSWPSSLLSLSSSSPPFPSSLHPPFSPFVFRTYWIGKKKEGGERDAGEKATSIYPFTIQNLSCLILFYLNKTYYAAFSSKFGKCLFRLKKGRGERGTVGREGGRRGPSILC